MTDAITLKQRKRRDWWPLAIFVVAAVVGGVMVERVREWGVMPDELLYSGMARSMWSAGVPLPRFRGELVAVNQVLFPALIAPIVGTMKMPTAYHVIAVLNAVLFASAAFPAYLAARFVTQNPVAARFVAACTVAVPWLAFAGKVMTDAIAYPLFLWAFYAILRSAYDKTRRTEWLALLALAAAYLARSQFVLLFAVWPAAAIARDAAAAFSRRRRIGDAGRALLRSPLERPLALGVLLVIAVVLVAEPKWIVGVYTSATGGGTGTYAPGGLLRALGTHLGMIAIGVGGVPLVLGLPWLLAALGRVDDARQNSAALAIAICSLAVLYVGTAFDLRFSLTGRVFERYIFYIAPLMLIAAASLFEHPPRHWVAFAVPAIAAMFVFAAEEHYGLDSPLTVLLNLPFAPVRIFEIALQKAANVLILSITQMFVIASALVAGGVWWAISRGKAQFAMRATFASVLAYCLVATFYTVPKAVTAQNDFGVDNGHRSAAEKTWLSRYLGGGRAAIVEASFAHRVGRHDYITAEDIEKWRDLEFWNGKVSSFYSFRPPATGSTTFAPSVLHVDWPSGAIKLRRGESAKYLVMSSADARFAPVTRSNDDVIRHGPFFSLYKFAQPARAAWATQGLTLHGWVPPKGATLRVYGWPGTQTGGTVAVEIYVRNKRGSPGALEVPRARRVRSLGRAAVYVLAAKPAADGKVDFPLRRSGGQEAKIVGIRLGAVDGGHSPFGLPK